MDSEQRTATVGREGLSPSEPAPMPPHIAEALRQTWERIDAILKDAPPDLSERLHAERTALDACVRQTFLSIFDFGFYRGYCFGLEKAAGVTQVQ